MKIDWVKKLTSRKFWLAVCGLASGLVLAFTGNDSIAQTVSGCVMSVGSVIGYIIGEGLTDSAHTSESDSDNKDDNTAGEQ